ncbi:unnamed protein product [Linum trigynum]|uniref:Uncharacterized protein n=1 Tax=Linum trigynum TaxID=586398 RepID=A0AAV2E7X4_9ROSI
MFSETKTKFLHELTVGDNTGVLKLRLIHSWKSTNPANPGYVYDYSTLWVDETGMLIHGLSDRNFAGQKESKLSTGSVYCIKEFITRPAKELYRPCMNNICISIVPATDFEDVTAFATDFVSDNFDFCQFESLRNRVGSNKILTGRMYCAYALLNYV